MHWHCFLFFFYIPISSIILMAEKMSPRCSRRSSKWHTFIIVFNRIFVCFVYENRMAIWSNFMSISIYFSHSSIASPAHSCATHIGRWGAKWFVLWLTQSFTRPIHEIDAQICGSDAHATFVCVHTGGRLTDLCISMGFYIITVSQLFDAFSFVFHVFHHCCCWDFDWTTQC